MTKLYSLKKSDLAKINEIDSTSVWSVFFKKIKYNSIFCKLSKTNLISLKFKQKPVGNAAKSVNIY